MSDSKNAKGRALEDVIALIEDTILKTDPGLAGREIRIEPRKIVVVKGVRHEIDLWVELLAEHGYGSLFIFESKNWIDKVGKNEVIVFSEKIKAVQAQRGYIVAREFTADARAQAAQDERVRLLEVREEQYANFQIPIGAFPVHTVAIDKWDVEVDFNLRAEKDFRERVDFESAEAVLDGQPIKLMEYLDPWRAKLVEETVGRYPTISTPSGTYTIEGTETRDFSPGSFVLNGREVTEVMLKVIPTFRVIQPVLVSSVEVVGRGRVLKFEPMMLGGAEVFTNLVAIPRANREGEPSD